MKETKRTVIFVGAAVVCAALALGTHWLSQPKPPAEFADVGGEFYPRFKDPTKAKNLEVIAYNEDTATAQRFAVVYKNGLWRIPSHHDYPADGEERLAKTAASMIGVKKEEFRSRSEADHEALGVINPLDESVTTLKGRGHRITLKAEDGTILADFIIGKQLKDRPGYYYIREPDQRATYVAKLNIDLSTKFADWIKTDLLELDRDDLVKVVVNKYSVDETQGKIVDRQFSELDRKTAADSWTLKDLNPETEELNTSNVNTLVNNLDDLKIVGVRPKPAGLSEDLKSDKGLQIDALTALDLQSKGFFVGREGLIPTEGEVAAGTNKGVVYVLRFGKMFSGSDLEIETGLTNDDKADSGKTEAGATSQAAADSSGTEKQDAESAEQTDDENGDAKTDNKKKDDLKRSRYLFVTVHFDKSLLGEPPSEPTKPTPPDAGGKHVSGEAAHKAAGETLAVAFADGDASSTSAEPGNPPSGGLVIPASGTQADEGSGKPADAEKPDAPKSGAGQESGSDAKQDTNNKESESQKQYEEANRKYEADLANYKSDKKQYDEKVETGQKQVKDLNERFANWYYVISAGSFEELSLGRKSLVKEKKTPESAKPDTTKDQSADHAEPETPGNAGPNSSDETPAAQPAVDDAGSKTGTGEPSPPAGNSETSSSSKPDETPAQKADPFAAPEAKAENP